MQTMTSPPFENIRSIVSFACALITHRHTQTWQSSNRFIFIDCCRDSRLYGLWCWWCFQFPMEWQWWWRRRRPRPFALFSISFHFFSASFYCWMCINEFPIVMSNHQSNTTIFANLILLKEIYFRMECTQIDRQTDGQTATKDKHTHTQKRRTLWFSLDKQCPKLCGMLVLYCPMCTLTVHVLCVESSIKWMPDFIWQHFSLSLSPSITWSCVVGAMSMCACAHENCNSHVLIEFARW